jgi:hypothetical protein
MHIISTSGVKKYTPARKYNSAVKSDVGKWPRAPNAGRFIKTCGRVSNKKRDWRWSAQKKADKRSRGLSIISGACCNLVGDAYRRLTLYQLRDLNNQRPNACKM